MMKKFKDLQKKKGKKGFSMIELIIVIAIMAILIALIGTQLLPWLEKSRRSKDLTTMDTILTNFKGALTSSECTKSTESVTIVGGKDNNFSDLDNKFAPGVAAAYKELAGEAYDEPKEICDAFKSKEAKNDGTATQITFGIVNGKCYIKVVGTGAEYGGLFVSDGYSGTYYSDKDKKSISTGIVEAKKSQGVEANESQS